VWLDLTGRGLRRDVVEINVSLQVALLHELDRLELGIDLILQFIIVVFVLEVVATASHVLLVLVETVAQRLLAVFVDHGGLCFENELFALFPLSFLLYLTDL